MDNTQMARQAWGGVQDHMFLWVLGFLSSVIRLIDQAPDLYDLGNSGAEGAGAAVEQAAPLTGGELALEILILGNMIGLFLLLWLISAVANSALLYSVAELDANKPAGLWSALKTGIRFVPRMIAASILLYLPLLLLTGAVFVVAFVSEMQPTGNANALILPLLCVVMLYMLFMLPLLAFTHRAIVVERLGVFAAIRRGKGVFLKKIGPTFGLAILVFTYAIPFLLAVLVASAIHLVVGIVVATIVVSILAAFQSAAFTLAYREWTGMRAEVQPGEVQLAPA
jgi:hypothetical protein